MENRNSENKETVRERELQKIKRESREQEKSRERQNEPNMGISGPRNANQGTEGLREPGNERNRAMNGTQHLRRRKNSGRVGGKIELLTSTPRS